MRTYQLYMVNDFSGGLNVKAAPMSIADNQAVDMLNFEMDVTGALVKRQGYTLYNQSPVADATSIDGMIRFYRNDGAKTLVIAVPGASGMKVYKGTDAGGTFSEITGGTALSASEPVDMLVYRDTLFLSNGTQPIQYYQSGSTKADLSGSPAPPAGSYMAVCDNRLFVAGDASNPNTIRFSGIALFSTLPDVDFPAANTINIPKQDTGDRITGMAVYRDELFVFRRNDVWALLGSGPDDYYLQEVNNCIGALGHRAIANTGDSLVFVSPGGVFEFADGSMSDIGLTIEPLISGMNFSDARAVYYPAKRQVWISAASGSGVNDRVLVFDRVHRAWSVFDLASSAMCVFCGTGDSGEIYGGSPAEGTVFRMDNGVSDNGENIAFSYTTKHFHLGVPQTRKTFRRLYFNVNASEEQGAFGVVASVDFGRLLQDLGGIRLKGFNRWGGFVYGRASYGGGQLQTAACALCADMSGRYMSLTLSGEDKLPLTVYSIGVQHKIRRMRGE